MNQIEKNELKEYKERTFENIKHINEFGNEYWEARELMIVPLTNLFELFEL